MRCIAQHEDALCELLHEAQHGAASSSLKGELLMLVNDLPTYDYLDDLDGLRDMLGQARTTPGGGRKRHKGVKPAPAKKPAKQRRIVAAPLRVKNMLSRKNELRTSGRKPSR
jgi:hypothetical protein